MKLFAILFFYFFIFCKSEYEGIFKLKKKKKYLNKYI